MSVNIVDGIGRPFYCPKCKNEIVLNYKTQYRLCDTCGADLGNSLVYVSYDKQNSPRVKELTGFGLFVFGLCIAVFIAIMVIILSATTNTSS